VRNQFEFVLPVENSPVHLLLAEIQAQRCEFAMFFLAPIVAARANLQVQRLLRPRFCNNTKQAILILVAVAISHYRGERRFNLYAQNIVGREQWLHARIAVGSQSRIWRRDNSDSASQCNETEGLESIIHEPVPPASGRILACVNSATLQRCQ
jgi:hypothetical protein